MTFTNSGGSSDQAVEFQAWSISSATLSAPEVSRDCRSVRPDSYGTAEDLKVMGVDESDERAAKKARVEEETGEEEEVTKRERRIRSAVAEIRDGYEGRKASRAAAGDVREIVERMLLEECDNACARIREAIEGEEDGAGEAEEEAGRQDEEEEGAGKDNEARTMHTKKPAHAPSETRVA